MKRITKKIKKYYYLSNDLVYKNIFGTTKNKKFTQRLLELLLNQPLGSLNDFVILNSVKLIPNYIKTRKLEMDILVYIPSLNMKVILEMQHKLDEYTLTKAYVYLCTTIEKEYKSGEKGFTSTSKLKQIIFGEQICEYCKRLRKGYLCFETEDKSLINLFNKLVDIEIIDIDKYDEKCYNKGIKELEMWFALMKANTQEQLKNIRKIGKTFTLIKEAIEEMDKFNKELYGQEYWLNDRLLETKLIRKYDSGFNDGKAAGFNDGKVAGFNDGKAVGSNERNYEIAKKMLQNNKPISEVKLFTNLPTKEIKRLVKSLK